MPVQNICDAHVPDRINLAQIRDPNGLKSFVGGARNGGLGTAGCAIKNLENGC